MYVAMGQLCIQSKPVYCTQSPFSFACKFNKFTLPMNISLETEQKERTAFDKAKRIGNLVIRIIRTHIKLITFSAAGAREATNLLLH